MEELDTSPRANVLTPCGDGSPTTLMMRQFEQTMDYSESSNLRM